MQQKRHLQLEKHCYDSLKNWLRQVQKDCGNIKKLLSIGAEQKVKQSKTKSIKKHHGGNEKSEPCTFFCLDHNPLQIVVLHQDQSTNLHRKSVEWFLNDASLC